MPKSKIDAIKNQIALREYLYRAQLRHVAPQTPPVEKDDSDDGDDDNAWGTEYNTW